MRRPARSVSILARDAATGDLGYAALVDGFEPRRGMIRAGIGAAVAQGFAAPTLAARALDTLAAGKTAEQAVTELTAEAPDVQLGVLAANGQAMAYTGEGCVAQASHHHGKDFTAQASTAKASSVVPAMVSAWEGSAGQPLPERLLGCLESAFTAGGDIRGNRAATLLVTQPIPELRVDLHVADHDTPVAELGRLLALFRAAEHVADGDAALVRGDQQAAIGFFTTAADLDPDNIGLKYRLALLHQLTGDDLRATATFRKLFAQTPDWAELTRRLGTAGVIDQELVAKILTANGG